MNDDQTSVADLRQMVERFVAERKWQPFHTPKNLAMALAIEAAELMEHFQWLTAEEALAISSRPEALSQVADELADVVCYALAMANALHLDVAASMEAKMAKNAQKYPAGEFQGRWEKPAKRE